MYKKIVIDNLTDISANFSMGQEKVTSPICDYKEQATSFKVGRLCSVEVMMFYSHCHFSMTQECFFSVS